MSYNDYDIPDIGMDDDIPDISMDDDLLDTSMGDADYDHDSGNEFVGLGILALVGIGYVAVKGTKSIIYSNFMARNCDFCNIEFKNKELTELSSTKIDALYPSINESQKYVKLPYEIIQKYVDKLACPSCCIKIFDEMVRYSMSCDFCDKEFKIFRMDSTFFDHIKAKGDLAKSIVLKSLVLSSDPQIIQYAGENLMISDLSDLEKIWESYELDGIPYEIEKKYLNMKYLSEFMNKCEHIAGKKICNKCYKKNKKELEKIRDDEIEKLIEKEKMEKEELEKSKVLCSRCDKKFLNNKNQDWSCKTYGVLPKYWIIRQSPDEQLCNNCIINIEKLKYKEAESKIKNNDIEWHPITHKGKWVDNVDDTIIEKNVSSDYYRYREDAKNELCLRAYQKGFNVVINGRFDYMENHDDNYTYKEWKATGDFAKWKTY